MRLLLPPVLPIRPDGVLPLRSNFSDDVSLNIITNDDNLEGKEGGLLGERH